MNDVIKKSFIGGLIFLGTVVIGAVTYATFTTVTTGQTLTADMWNSMAGNYDYSTSEVDTGKKWIDGRPIYRKIYNFGLNRSDNIDHSLALGVLNFDRPVFIDFAFRNTYGNWITSSSSLYKSSTEIRYAYTSGSSVYFRGYAIDQTKEVYVIVEYLKTTD